MESKAAQFALSDVASLVAAGASAKNGRGDRAEVPARQVYSLRSGANVSKPQQLENQEIGSGEGSGGRKVIEAFMTSTGLKNPRRWIVRRHRSRGGFRHAGGRFRKTPAIETSATSMPAVMKAVGVQNAQIFLLANNGLSLYGNGIVAREDYIKANAAQVRASVKASLEGWKDTGRQSARGRRYRVAEREGSRSRCDIPGGRDRQRSRPRRRTAGLGLIDAKQMAASVDLTRPRQQDSSHFDRAADENFGG